jgi:hypothetical protein
MGILESVSQCTWSCVYIGIILLLLPLSKSNRCYVLHIGTD